MEILISSRSFGKTDAIDYIKKNGLKVKTNPYGRKMTEEELLFHGKNCIGMIAGTEKITEKFINGAEKLKVISRYGVGMDNIDIDATKKKNIAVYNTPDAPSIAVAELTLTLILCTIKKINIVDKRIKEGIWKPEMGNMLSNKKIGIIGLGRIGKVIVQMLKPFNAEIRIFDINQDIKFCKNNNIKNTSLINLLKESDIVSLHIPLNDKTYHMIGKKELEIMKDSAIIINTSRGGIIREDALYNAIKEKRIAGAAIDVFENEPNVGKLKDLENIILTPHIATYTFETRKQMEMEATKNLIDGLKGFRLL